MAEFLTLGIESSCDETAVAVIADGIKIKSNIISSQLDLHARFGGVVPELAARSHLEVIVPIYRVAMEEAGVGLADINLIAATYGPGLVGSLLVGLTFAKGLALAGNIPLVAVNHIEGHIYANVLERPPIQPPLLCLTVSGGHTDLLYLEKWGVYKILGRTRDDAAGEAFDKVARVLGLGYPGGPAIDNIARGVPGDLEFTRMSRIRVLPDTYDFSFSGLKTAVINYLHRQKQMGREIEVSRMAAGFQKVAVEQLLDKLFKAVNDYQVQTVLLSGGVAANSYLRHRCKIETDSQGIKLYFPDSKLCTDNAAMIAAAGHFRYWTGITPGLEITAQPDLRL
jgi:N6-L-threonylcarbamoyladenine synthase